MNTKERHADNCAPPSAHNLGLDVMHQILEDYLNTNLPPPELQV